MNRRTFFQWTLGATVAAVCAPLLAPVVRWKSKLWTGVFEPSKHQITWHADVACPMNQMYFVNRDGIWRLNGKKIEHLNG